MGKHRNTTTIVLLLVASCLSAAPARAEFVIAVEGYAGNFLVGAESYLVDDSQGTLETGRAGAAIGFDQAFRLTYTDAADPSIWFQFSLGAPNNQPLAVGIYANALGHLGYDPAAPFIDASALGRGCNGGSGEFNIKEVVESADGLSLLQFAADLTHFCEGGGSPLRASIRLNTTLPLWDGEPDTDAGDDQIVAPLDVVQLDGSASAAIDGLPLSYRWTQTRGTPVVLDDTTAAGPTFTAPGPIAREYQFLEFELQSTDTSMRSSSDTVIVTVTETPNLQTLFNSDFDEGTFFRPARVIHGPLDPESIEFSYQYPSSMGLRYSVEPDDPVTDRLSFGMDLQASIPHTIGEGIYYSATRELNGSSFEWLTFGENYQACGDDRGTFNVLEAVFAPNGVVERLAVDFDHRCVTPGSWDGQLNGVLRFNSAVPVSSRAPTAAPGPHRVAFSGDVVSLEAGSSFSGATPIETYMWRQTAGQTVSLSGDEQAVASFLAPDVAAGTGGMTFDLNVTNEAGYSDTGTVNVTVLGPDDPKNYAKLFADPDEYDIIMWGEDRYFDDNNALFTMRRDSLALRQYSRIGLQAPDAEWVIRLAPVLGQALTPGVYRDFSTDPTVTTRPYFHFTGDGTGCSRVAGEFIIHEVELRADGNIERLALDLTHLCTSQSPDRITTGVVRYNSTIPDLAPDPVAEIIGDPTVISGMEVTLDSSGSYPGADGIATIEWEQIGGPAVTIPDLNAPSISFTPEFAGNSPVPLQFQVTITTNDGRVSTATYSVDVIPEGVPFSAIAVESDSGDFIGRGRTIYLDIDDVEFSSGNSWAYQAIVRTTGVERWSFQFATPDRSPLTPGNYEFALRSVQGLPQINVSSEGRACNMAVGRFVVHEVTWLPNETIGSLAVDFEQNCEYQGPLTRGSLRYNSTVPLIPQVPNAAAGNDQVQAERSTIQLDGSDSHDADGQIIDYAWSQISGPAVMLDDAASVAPSFLSPDVLPGDAVVEFELTVTDNDGNSDADVIAVTILDDLSPRNLLYMRLADPGPTVAVGDTYLSDNNASFSSPNFLFTQDLQVFVDTLWPYGFWFYGQGDALIEEGRHYEYTRSFWGGDDPYMAAVLDGTVYGGEGWFDVLEVQTSGDRIVSLAADFKHQVVERFPPSVGSLRYNSAVPIRTSFVSAFAAGPTPGSAMEGYGISLSGLDSFATESNIVRYDWRVIEGPAVVFSNEAEAPTIVAPAIPATDSLLDLVIELEVEDDEGMIDTDQLVIAIIDNGVSDFPDDMLTLGFSSNTPLGVSVEAGDLVFSEYVISATPGGDTDAEPDTRSPYGMWLLRVLAPSGSATLTFHAPNTAFDEDTRWTTNTESSGWQQFQGDQSFSGDRTMLNIELADGGDDDLDGVVNGTVEIRGTLGVFRADPPPPPPPPAPPPTQPSGGSGGGGSTTPVSLLLLIMVSLWSRSVMLFGGFVRQQENC